MTCTSHTLATVRRRSSFCPRCVESWRRSSVTRSASSTGTVFLEEVSTVQRSVSACAEFNMHSHAHNHPLFVDRCLHAFTCTQSPTVCGPMLTCIHMHTITTVCGPMFTCIHMHTITTVCGPMFTCIHMHTITTVCGPMFTCIHMHTITTVCGPMFTCIHMHTITTVCGPMFTCIHMHTITTVCGPMFTCIHMHTITTVCGPMFTCIHMHTITHCLWTDVYMHSHAHNHPLFVDRCLQIFCQNERLKIHLKCLNF